MIEDSIIWIVVLAFIIAFVLAFAIGANDVANSFGTSVGSKVLTMRQAFIIATICETLGAISMGAKVGDTLRKGVFNYEALNSTNNTDDNVEFMLKGNLASLTGACIWLIIATFLKLPVSGSHSIVGAVVGFILVAYGYKAVNWWKVGMIVLSWFLSPVLSGCVSILIFFIFKIFILKKEDPVEPGLRFLPFIYAVAIFINILSILMSAPQYMKFNVIPLWGKILISIGISIIVLVLIKLILVRYLRRKLKKQFGGSDFNLNDNQLNNGNTLAESHTSFNPTVIASDENIINDSSSKRKSVIIEDKPQQNTIFGSIQILAAVFSSFAHGGNDVSNAIGPLIAVWVISITKNITTKMETPIWILLYGSVGMALGLWVLGSRVIKTVGQDLTKITPSSGVSIELGAAITVISASNIGLPISTTHCKVGSVVSVGRFRSANNVNWRLMINVVLAWVVTVPFAGAISALLTFIMMQL